MDCKKIDRKVKEEILHESKKAKVLENKKYRQTSIDPKIKDKMIEREREIICESGGLKNRI